MKRQPRQKDRDQKARAAQKQLPRGRHLVLDAIILGRVDQPARGERKPIDKKRHDAQAVVDRAIERGDPIRFSPTDHFPEMKKVDGKPSSGLIGVNQFPVLMRLDDAKLLRPFAREQLTGAASGKCDVAVNGVDPTDVYLYELARVQRPFAVLVTQEKRLVDSLAIATDCDVISLDDSTYLARHT